MKKLRKIIPAALLILFGFSLQSFNGYRIEKRHYRKGYYIHICHNVKTHPVYASTVSTSQKQERPINQEEQRSIQQHAPDRMQRNDNEPSRNINAPVSSARVPSN